VQDLGPGAVCTPAVEAIIDSLPGAIARRGIGPRGAGVQVPEDAVDQRPVVLPGATGLTVVVAVGEKGCKPLPLGVGETVAIHGWPPWGNPPISRDGINKRTRSNSHTGLSERT